MALSIFATRLKEMRTQAGLTKSQLAKQTNLTTKDITEYEKFATIEIKKDDFNREHITRIADFFDVTPDWLIGLASGKKYVYMGDGAETTQRNGVFKVSEVKILKDDSPKFKKGRYVTIETPNLGRITDDFEQRVMQVAEEIKAYLPSNDSDVLVVGLGNKDLVSDSLGPRFIDGIMATGMAVDDFEELSYMRRVFALAPGTAGQRGMLTADTVTAVA
jgi:transcriptional regulator with XRE-family HTH domain